MVVKITAGLDVLSRCGRLRIDVCEPPLTRGKAAKASGVWQHTLSVISEFCAKNDLTKYREIFCSQKYLLVFFFSQLHGSFPFDIFCFSCPAGGVCCAIGCTSHVAFDRGDPCQHYQHDSFSLVAVLNSAFVAGQKVPL